MVARITAVIAAFILAVSVVGSGAGPRAEEEEWHRHASLVVKYETGYLVSVVPKTAAMDPRFPIASFPEWQKYAVDSSELRRHKTIFLPIHKSEYPILEELCRFRLADKIVFFGSQNLGNVIAQGESYYAMHNPIGYKPSVDDIMVFVPGTEDLDRILPVWAKKYSLGDEAFEWIDFRARRLTNFPNNESSLLERVHGYVKEEINRSAGKSGIKDSILEISDWFEEKVFSFRFGSTGGKTFLTVANGRSHFRNLKYSLAFVSDERLERIVDLAQTKILIDDRGDYLANAFVIEHLYHSPKADQDVVIARLSAGLGDRVYLIYGRENEILAIPIRVMFGC
jgi:hypothetical protein